LNKFVFVSQSSPIFQFQFFNSSFFSLFLLLPPSLLKWLALVNAVEGPVPVPLTVVVTVVVTVTATVTGTVVTKGAQSQDPGSPFLLHSFSPILSLSLSPDNDVT